MAKVRVLVSSRPDVLLAHAGSAFTHPRGATLPYLLALRQSTLRDDLFDLAAEHGVPGWLDPPLCVFQELADWLGSTERRPLAAIERTALLASVMRRAAGSAFQGRERDFQTSVEEFFGELCTEGVTPEAYARALESLVAREPYERNRDAELTRMYAAYVSELERLGKRDGRDDLADCAAALRASGGRLSARLGGRREIRIVGLMELRGGWRSLLSALADSPEVDRLLLYVGTTEALALPAELGATVELLDAPGATAPSISIVSAPDIDRELEEVTLRVRALVDSGTPPHRIAVVSRDARPYGDFAARTLTEAGVPVTARRRVSYKEIPVIRALLALLQTAADGWSRHALADLAGQPYLAGLLDAQVINFIGFRQRVMGLSNWIAAHERLEREARASEGRPSGKGEYREKLLPADWVTRATDRFKAFAVAAGSIEGARTQMEWLQWFSAWLDEDPWGLEDHLLRVPANRWDLVRIDRLGWEYLRFILRDRLTAERQWPSAEGSLSVRDFQARLSTWLEGEVIISSPGGGGVAVLEAQAASGRTFDHVFLVGMNAGRFPRRLHASLLMGEADRSALRGVGLPLETAEDWHARERTLFESLLSAATESVVLSYVSLDETGGDAIPSSFLDVLSDGHAVRVGTGSPARCRSPELALHAMRAAEIESRRATGLLSPWNGAIEDTGLRTWLAETFGDDRIWSPTEVEAFAKCPWAHFSGRLLRLRLHEDPDGDIDPRARGAVLHDALRRFYTGSSHRLGGPVWLKREDSGWTMDLLQASLAEALAAAEGRVWLGHPALRSVKLRELQQQLEEYIAFEIDENEKSFEAATTAGKNIRTVVSEHEVAFDQASLERGGITFRYRGAVDRVELGADDRAPGDWLAAVDYKNTIYSCPGGGHASAWTDGVVLQIPLYAWALGQLRPNATVARVEYRAIKQARRVHSLSLVKVSARGAAPNPPDADRMEQALDAVVRHVRRLRQGEFPAQPAPSCHCPPFCHAWDICRVPGGPTTGRD